MIGWRRARRPIRGAGPAIGEPSWHPGVFGVSVCRRGVTQERSVDGRITVPGVTNGSIDSGGEHPKTRLQSSPATGRRAPTAGCLFSGMGGFASGLADAGFEIRWANDSDPYACETFRHRFPGIPLFEKDVCDLSVEGDRLAAVDLLAGGFPCQSFSQAGDRRGFDDPRGTLFFEIDRLLRELSASVHRPRLVVLENVPHLLYGAAGEWFDEVRRRLRQAGYWFREESCWTVNVKDVTDVPQDRERLFMVAASREHFSRNPFSPSAACGKSESGRSASRRAETLIDRRRRADPTAYLPPDNRYYKMIDAAMAAGQSKRNLYQLRRSYVREKLDGLCPTLTANMGIGGHNVPFVRDRWGIRRLKVEEVARFQGFESPEGLFPDIPEKERYRLLGNAVCAKLARLVGLQCAHILREGV